MMIQHAASRAILTVERAIGELRRGMGVLLTQGGAPVCILRSGEHFPDEAPAPAPTHPGTRLLKLAGLLPLPLIGPANEAEGLLGVDEADIAAYPSHLVHALVQVSDAAVPLADAPHARVIAFRPRHGHEEHLAVMVGDPAASAAPLVRIHSSCVTGDIFGSLRCDCGPQLSRALALMEKNGAGIVLYLSQEGRGIGIANKLRAYRLQDAGMDTVEANEALGFAPDERDFALAAAMLRELGVTKVTLVTNNPEKIASLQQLGIDVAGREALVIPANEHNRKYLATKEDKMGHRFSAGCGH